jgi:hypothetical protein
MPRSYAWDQCVVGKEVGSSLPEVGKSELDVWPHASPASAAAGANAGADVDCIASSQLQD